MLVEMEGGGASKPPQFSEMFQKLALAVKTKTFELFADEENDAAMDALSLLDSAEEFITDQKVVVIKPDPTRFTPPSPNPRGNSNELLPEALISALFATISSFEASYLQLQTAHVPFNEKAIEAADESLVSVFEKLADLRNLYRNFRRNPSGNFAFEAGSLLEFQVQENQSKLRALETMVNQLQSDIDSKDDQVLNLRKKLEKIESSNSNLSKRLGLRDQNPNKMLEVLLTIRVFESILSDSVKSLRSFTKLLIDLMRKACWDLDKAANSVYSDVVYLRRGHSKYAFLSYVCLVMFRAFDLDDYGLSDIDASCNGNGAISTQESSMKQLIDHVWRDPMEVLNKNPKSEFSRFCETKYEKLIHPTMESSIFSNSGREETIVDSWKSLSVFYDSFVRMASSVWLLHKLAYSFHPVVEIFQVERGANFSMVYMEDVIKKNINRDEMWQKVGFTVVPGFKIGGTIIQSQVYLTG